MRLSPVIAFNVLANSSFFSDITTVTRLTDSMGLATDQKRKRHVRTGRRELELASALGLSISRNTIKMALRISPPHSVFL